MSITTDPNDPRLVRGVDKDPRPQNDVYLVLSEEERAKGFVRPYRDSYKHVGNGGPKHQTRPLSDDEKSNPLYQQQGYVLYEKYPLEMEPLTGKMWTQDEIDRTKGCGTITTMSRALSETYARDPKFYGGTYCCGCRRHLPVAEFRWTADNEVVGSLAQNSRC